MLSAISGGVRLNYLAIDLGGTAIKYALMNADAEILEKSKIKTPVGSDQTIADLMEALGNIILKYHNHIKGIALSLPGVVDSTTGYSYSSGAIHYVAENNLAQLIQEKYNLPVSVENDGKCAALAELWKGSLAHVQNGAVVLLGTGVGGGIIIDGKLYKGNRFAAGELSFMLSNPAKQAFWGSTGGTPQLLRLTSKKTNVSVDELDGVKVFEMISAGDKNALVALDEYTEHLVYQLYNLQALLDLDVFAIGGGISQQPILMEYLQKHIDDFCSNHPFRAFMPYIPTPKITTCQFFNDSNLIGALYHHLSLNQS